MIDVPWRFRADRHGDSEDIMQIVNYSTLDTLVPEFWYWILFAGFILIVILGIYTLWTMSKRWDE